MTRPATTQPATDRFDGAIEVFNSYSRRDSIAFADQLSTALEACGHKPIIDCHGILSGEEEPAGPRRGDTKSRDAERLMRRSLLAAADR